MTKIFIDGSAGTTGLRIADRLALRHDIELIKLPDELRKNNDARKEALHSADIAFLCLPDAAAIEAVRKEAAEEAAKAQEAANADKKALEEKVASLEAKVAEQEKTIAEKDETIKELSEEPAKMPQPAVVQTKQTVQEKPLLASDYNNRKEAKAAHENLMQMLRDRM